MLLEMTKHEKIDISMWNIWYSPIVCQKNLFDCGVYCCLFAEGAARNSMDVTEADTQLWRKQIINHIVGNDVINK